MGGDEITQHEKHEIDKDEDIDKLDSLLVQLSGQTYMYYYKQTIEEFMRAFNKGNMRTLSDKFFAHFVNDTFSKFFVKIKSETFYTDVITDFCSFFVVFFISRIELVDKNGWGNFASVFYNEEFYKKKSAYSAQLGKMTESDSVVMNLALDFQNANGFEEVEKVAKSMDCEIMSVMLNAVNPLFTKINDLGSDQYKEDFAHILFEWIPYGIKTSTNTQQLRTCVTEIESMLKCEYIDFPICENMANNLNSFDQRLLFFQAAGRLLDTISKQNIVSTFGNSNEKPFKTREELVDVFLPSLSILNESIQKQILVTALPVLRFLAKNGHKEEIFGKCLTIIGSGHISIVEVVLPFFKEIVEEGIDDTTFEMIVSTLQKVDEKTMGHFELMCDLVLKRANLLDTVFTLFVKLSDLDVKQMAQVFSKIVLCGSEIFSGTIARLRDDMVDYSNTREIVFIENVISILAYKGENEVLTEKEVKEMEVEIITSLSQAKPFKAENIDIVDEGLEVLLAMSLNDIELPLTLFGELWEIFMAANVDARMRGRLFGFFNRFFEKESESKELALIPLDEHVHNDDEIQCFDSVEGVELIKKMIEEVNGGVLIKKGEGYEFKGNLNDIGHIPPLKHLLVYTHNSKTFEKGMELLVNLVKSVQVQDGWKVVCQWISDINNTPNKTDALQKEQENNLKLLIMIFSEWTKTSEGKAISHIRSLKGKPMEYKVTVIDSGNVTQNTITVLSSMTIGEVKKYINKEFNIEVSNGSFEIEGVDDLDDSNQMGELLLPNESEIKIEMKKKVEESTFREEKHNYPSYKKEVKIEDVNNIVEMCGVSKQLAYCALKKYAYYANNVDMACTALLDDMDAITQEYLRDLEKGEVYDIPEETEKKEEKKTDLSFVKLVSDSIEIGKIVDCLKYHYNDTVNNLVWDIMMSLPSFEYIIKTLRLTFENDNSNQTTKKQIFTLLTNSSGFLLLYTLQLLDKVLFPENDNELSTTTDTIKSNNLLRETIVKSQSIFNQFCEAFKEVLRRDDSLELRIIDKFAKIFMFFIKKMCKHNNLSFSVYENESIFTKCLELVQNNPDKSGASEIFISIASSICELRLKKYSIKIDIDFHQFIVKYFVEQQNNDEEQMTVMSFIDVFINFLKSDDILLYSQIKLFTEDLEKCFGVYGHQRAIHYYFTTLHGLIEMYNGNLIDFQHLFTTAITLLKEYKSNEKFTDASDFFAVGVLKLLKLLFVKVKTTPEEMEELSKILFSKCYSVPLEYKLKQVRNAVYELLGSIFDIFPQIVKQFSTDVFDEFFQYKQCQKLEVVPKTSRTGYRGLSNSGSTCYVNSIIQQMFMIEEFRETLLRIRTDEGMKVTIALQKLFISLKGGSQDYYSADTLIDAVEEHKKRNDLKSHQHDACDFLVMLLDCLEDEMSKGNKQLIFPIFTLNMLNVTDSLDPEIQEHRETKEDFRLLPLPIQGRKNVGVCLTNLFKPEIFRGDNKLKTDSGKYFAASKKYKIDYLPHYLFVQLNRFDSFGVDVMKINDECDVPNELDLQSYLKENIKEDGMYDLEGVVVHMGNSEFGHYISYVLVDKKWMEFNDVRVMYSNPEIAMRNINGGYKDFGGYLLIYKKREFCVENKTSEVNEEILRELKAEEYKISNDVMYHDNQCLKFVLKYVKLFDQSIFEKSIGYCYSYSFSALNDGEQSLLFVDKVLQLLHDCNNPSLGESILSMIIGLKAVENHCLTATEPIRARAAELIKTAIKWVAVEDKVELFDENAILFKFYQYIRSLLVYSRSFPRNLKQYFMLFDALANIGYKACYMLAKMGLLRSFWCYFKNKNENTGESLHVLIDDFYPDLTYFVTTFQKVGCSTFQSDFNDCLSPYANTQDKNYITDAFFCIREDFFKDTLVRQLLAYNYESGAILLQHLTYNDFEVSLNLVNQFKGEINSDKVDQYTAFLETVKKVLLVEDDFQELRVYALLSPYSIKQTSSMNCALPKAMAGGLLKKYDGYTPKMRETLHFIVELTQVNRFARSVVIDNIGAIEKMVKCLNDYFVGNYTQFRGTGLDSQSLDLAKAIMSSNEKTIANQREYSDLVELLKLVEEREKKVFDTKKLEADLKEVKQEYMELKGYKPETVVPSNSNENFYNLGAVGLFD
ncbi:hypothetical protein EIN_064670 [Entamoeba invadens IP1]|uniref:USP domain-containing protein n=1 Tax=Entamoeba invadens IP1 TaxID=370355 RepID=A0A0A1TV77_ENTIV|nr:hypothetical protein EIN_064670 [Entamoeba invadens IP1]ELP84232.1 hypothetical protein EIN_064670 [Entamoeba invadens IP1]|eukprot:XP_004183578.1 hypothetical protein EIN_064670 [Entamoeba invadens IP1]